jgi:hypothetical protein
MNKTDLDPNKAWSDSFLSDGEMSVSYDPKTMQLDSDCVGMVNVKCTAAYWDEKGKLHLEFTETDKRDCL